jgi:hypothetical protein
VEEPDHVEVREAFDVLEAGLQFRQDLENPLGRVLGPEALGDP